MFHEYQSRFLFFLKSQKWLFDNILLGTGRDSCSRQCVRLVAALSRHCRYFLEMSPLSETTSGTVSEHTRYVSTIYIRLYKSFRGLVIAIVRKMMFALSALSAYI